MFVLKTGIPVAGRPGVSGMTCWKKLHEWQEAGVWDRLMEVLLARLQHADKIDSRSPVDSPSVRAVHGGEKTGPSPVDRAKRGSNHHVLTDAQGIPLAAKVTAANQNDITQLKPLVKSVPPVRGRRGRPRRRPKALQGDRGYDSEPHRRWLRRRGIRPLLARRQTGHGSGLGVYRWFVEHTHAWLHQMRRLRTLFGRRADIHQTFLTLGCAHICWNFVIG